MQVLRHKLSAPTVQHCLNRQQRIIGSGTLNANLEVGVEDVLLRLPFLQLLQRRLTVHPAITHTVGTVPISFQFLSHRGWEQISEILGRIRIRRSD
jgi:hypothetical protein